jgi:hypothetical protein
VQGQRHLAQRFVKNIEPAMIDPKQGPLLHPGRNDPHPANLNAKLASSETAKRPEPAPMAAVVK